MIARGVALVLFIGGCTDVDSIPASASSSGAQGGSGDGIGGGGTTGVSVGANGGQGGWGGQPPTCEDPNALLNVEMPPALLSETGLYSDISTLTLSSAVSEYSPAYELWSDGAQKRRWIHLPDAKLPGCQIDTSDIDHWSFPVGTRLWKEFALDDVRIETRLIHRYGPGESDFLYATYAWNDDGTEANLSVGGQVDALGTTHDIPDGAACVICHNNIPERVLGFGAVQLSHSQPGLTLAKLVQQGSLTEPPTSPIIVPGDGIAQAALGYLHANCGGCHTPRLSATFSVFSMRLRASDATVEDTDTFQQAVGVPPMFVFEPGITDRIAPGDPSASAVSFRMGSREPFTQMPPIGTEFVDDVGLAAVNAWIVDLAN